MVKIRIPATTANLGCGFDTFGMSLGYYNYVTVTKAAAFSVKIIVQGEKFLSLAGNNLVVAAAAAAYDKAQRIMPPLAFVCENNIPLSRGMGSSSAAIIGGIFAANELMGKPLSLQDMLDLAVSIEGHPDNVTPAIYGGFTVSAEENSRRYTARVELPDTLKAVLDVPDFQVSTKKARAAIPKEVAFSDAVYNLGHAAYMALSLQQGDISGFGAMLNDRLHQPYRFPLISGAEDVVEAAVAAGAIGCVISGSGPTMISFTEDDDILLDNIAGAMQEAFAHNGVDSRILTLPMDNEGTVVID